MVNRPTLAESPAERAAREARDAAAAQLGAAKTPEEEGIFSKIIAAIAAIFRWIFGTGDKNDLPNEVPADPSRPPPSISDRIRLGKAMVESHAIPKWREFTRARRGEKVDHQSPVAELTEVTSPYGMRVHPIYGDRRMHHGVDLAARGSSHTPDVLASASGIVIFSGYIGGYGNLVAVGHADGTYSVYAHLHEREMATMGSEVGKGQKIGVMSRSGDSTGVHLHYEQREGGESRAPHIAGASLADGVRVAAGKRAETSQFAALANREQLPKLPFSEATGKPNGPAFAPGAKVSHGATRS